MISGWSGSQYRFANSCGTIRPIGRRIRKPMPCPSIEVVSDHEQFLTNIALKPLCVF